MEKVELLDDELEKVTGGGAGSIPSGGVIGTTYATVEPGYYYAKVAKPVGDNNVVWTWGNPWGGINNSLEKLTVYPNDGDWVSSVIREVYNISESEIKANFPYRLNIRP